MALPGCVGGFLTRGSIGGRIPRDDP